jgi:molybdate transport system substrate-binding protein
MNNAPRARHLAVAIFAAFVSFTSASGQNAPSLKVMISGGFRAAYEELVPKFELKTGLTIVTAYGGSMGNAPNAIPNRLESGESADLVILASSALEELVKKHKVIPGTRMDLAQSIIAMAVRAGAPKPDISTLEGLKRTLLAARSIAYSDSTSGVYLSTELFQRLGIIDAIRSKCMRINDGMVGTVIARGDAEIGFQQLSELLPIAGIDIVGPIPSEAQKMTVYSGGVAVHSKQPAVAKQLLQFLASPEAAATIKRSGMQPVSECQTTSGNSNFARFTSNTKLSPFLIVCRIRNGNCQFGWLRGWQK